jgi:hypothetical protein
MTAEPIHRSRNPLDERTIVPGRAARHRSHRPFAHRRTRTSGIQRVATARALPLLTEVERGRRVDRVAAYLVWTMRACPAPGIAPFTTRDWLLVGGVVVLPYLLVFALATTAPIH